MERKATYHLPGLFEFYDLYRIVLPLYREHREWFYDWCGIGSVYGAPADCIWGGGRVGFGDIQKTYLPMGFSQFKIEGRGLGSAVILEFLLYYMTKPEYQLHVRETVYLDSMLDLF